jgi:hypothetical protein
MHPANCTCQPCSTPITVDEAFRLASHMAERGHHEAASEIAQSAITGAVLTVMRELAEVNA